MTEEANVLKFYFAPDNANADVSYGFVFFFLFYKLATPDSKKKKKRIVIEKK